MTSTHPRFAVPPVSIVTSGGRGCELLRDPAAERDDVSLRLAAEPGMADIALEVAAKASRETLRERTVSSSGPLGLRRTMAVAR